MLAASGTDIRLSAVLIATVEAGDFVLSRHCRRWGCPEDGADTNPFNAVEWPLKLSSSPHWILFQANLPELPPWTPLMRDLEWARITQMGYAAS